MSSTPAVTRGADPRRLCLWPGLSNDVDPKMGPQVAAQSSLIRASSSARVDVHHIPGCSVLRSATICPSTYLPLPHYPFRPLCLHSFPLNPRSYGKKKQKKTRLWGGFTTLPSPIYKTHDSSFVDCLFFGVPVPERINKQQ